MWNFLKAIFTFLGLVVIYIIIACTVGFIDEKLNEGKIRKKKKIKGIPLSSWLMSKSGRCLNCGSSRIFIQSNQQILNVWKKEQEKIKGLKCYIKFCKDCGHIEFFSTSILGNSIKRVYNYPILLMPINILFKGTKGLLKFLANLIPFLKLK